MFTNTRPFLHARGFGLVGSLDRPCAGTSTWPSRMRVIDRRTGQVSDEPQYGGRAAGWLYSTRVGRVLLNQVAIRAWFSRMVARRDRHPASRHRIGRFVAQHGIELKDYGGQPYASFRDFFVRPHLDGARPIAQDGLIAVADARLTIVPVGSGTVWVKGIEYAAADLLGEERLAEEFWGGKLLVFRLAMADGHRFVFPDDGEFLAERTDPGVLHTVGPAAAGVPVLQENARHWCRLRTRHLGDVVQVEVGAMLVGSIVQTGAPSRDTSGRSFTRGQEKGYFDLGGSTILLFLRPEVVTIDADLLANSAAGLETLVRMGERIGDWARPEQAGRLAPKPDTPLNPIGDQP